MAVEKVINIKVNSKGAQKDLDSLGKTIQEQKDITLEFEKELVRLENQLASTSKGNLAQQKITKDRIVDLKGALKDQRISLKELNNERSKSTKATQINTESLSRNYGVVQLLDQVTGGLASQVRSVVDANRLFNVSLKGTRTALLATGIGAFVVILASIVVYWDDIVELVQQTNEDLEKQLELNTANAGVLESEISLLDKQIKLLEKQGKGTEALQEQRKNLIAQSIELNNQEIKILEAQLARLKATQQELGLWEKIKAQVTETFLGQEEAAKQRARQIAEQTKAVLELEAAILKARGETLDLETVLFDTNNPEVSEEKRDKLDKVTGSGVDDLNSDPTIDREALRLKILLELNQNFLDERNAQDEKAADEAIALEDRIQKSKEEIRDASIQAVSNGIGLLKSLAGKSKSLQKTAVLADSAIGVGKIIINKNTADLADLAHSATLGPVAGPLYLSSKKILNTVSAGVGIASNLLATKKALSAIGGGGSPVGGQSLQGGGGGQSAPAFNLVEGTESNQISESLNRQNNPVRSYVVSSDITNSQELDRNIESSSSIG